MRPGLRSIISFFGVFLVVWLGLRYLMPLCFPFLLGLGLALLAEPVVSFLCRRLHFPRSVSAGVGVTAAFAAVTVLLVIACAFLVREMGILTRILPDLTQTAHSGMNLLQNWLLDIARRMPRGIRPVLEQNVQALFSGGSALLDRGFQYILGLAGSILSHVPDSALSLGTGIISAFMISAKLPRIRGWLKKRLPRQRLQPLRRTLGSLRVALGGWLIAQLKLAAMTLLLLTAGLLILRIAYAPLWALAISFLDALPVLGTGTVLLPWALICFLKADNARAVGLLGIYAVITLTRSVLEPKLVGKQLGLDPLVTLFALYAGYRLWGIGGMLLSPLLAVAGAHFLSGNGEKYRIERKN